MTYEGSLFKATEYQQLQKELFLLSPTNRLVYFVQRCAFFLFEHVTPFQTQLFSLFSIIVLHFMFKTMKYVCGREHTDTI